MALSAKKEATLRREAEERVRGAFGLDQGTYLRVEYFPDDAAQAFRVMRSTVAAAPPLVPVIRHALLGLGRYRIGKNTGAALVVTQRVEVEPTPISYSRVFAIRQIATSPPSFVLALMRWPSETGDSDLCTFPLGEVRDDLSHLAKSYALLREFVIWSGAVRDVLKEQRVKAAVASIAPTLDDLFDGAIAARAEYDRNLPAFEAQVREDRKMLVPRRRSP